MADIRPSSYEFCLKEMNDLYDTNPGQAVRSQGFIKTFHGAVAAEFRGRLSRVATKKGVCVVEEAKIFGSSKEKSVDIGVIHPTSGPLLAIGVRSQMSSVGKNIMTYYQDIIGECVSLQERFPMMIMGYIYIHPLTAKDGKTPNHERFAKLYASIAARDDRLYKNQIGSYDQFAYLVVDFEKETPQIRDDIVSAAVDGIDLSITTFVDRMIKTFNKRNVWLDTLFN